MYGIESKENFKLEVAALLDRIKRKINATATFIHAYNSQNKNIITKLGVLKIQEFRMKDALEWLDTMGNKEWQEHKKNLHNDFKVANDTLNAIA